MSTNSARCAACKYLRKRCPSNCIFYPYFPSNDPQRFEYVHKIYGASNIARMLQKIPVELREQAANTLHYEAYCRVQDPVYGCVKIISQLQEELNWAHNQLVMTQAQIALMLDIYGPLEEPVSGPPVSVEDYHSGFGNYDDIQPNIDGLVTFDLFKMVFGLNYKTLFSETL